VAKKQTHFVPVDQIVREGAVLLNELRTQLPGRPRWRTVRLWVTQGVIPHAMRGRPNTGKHRVQLQTVDHPLGSATSMEAYRRFIVALNDHPQARRNGK